MRVVVALEHHFFSTPDGTVYPKGETDYKFFARYLDVFDEVVVFGRVEQVERLPKPLLPASGPGVSFVGLDYYRGPWQYLKVRRKLIVKAKDVLQSNDAYVLRIPGAVGTILWHQIMRQNRPYGAEVVGDPWDSLSPRSVKSLARPLARVLLRRGLVRQCHLACATAYVTEYSLQKRYPPGRWSTSYSSIELPADAIATDSGIRSRIDRLRQKKRDGLPWRLCYVGTMEQLYKSPDILIEAVAICIKKGCKLELVMIGDGQFRQQLEGRARQLGISDAVEFLGYLPPGDIVYNKLDQADLYVLPSRQEGLPRSVIEAMARGLPCIASNVGGIPELLEPWYMVEPNEVGALAKKIESFLDDQQRLTKAVERNVGIASKYRSDVLQVRRVEFYKKVEDAKLAAGAS